MAKLHLAAVVSSLLLATVPALAASDYLLQLEPVKGQGKDAAAPQNIEVESFSWGASQQGTAASGSGATGKVNVQDISVMKTHSPRDAASGMASGKRAASAAVTTSAADGQPAAAVAPPKVGDIASFTVVTSAPGDKSGACATGTHFPRAVIVARGARYEFTDVVETSCTVVNGKSRKEFSGHVTLMK